MARDDTDADARVYLCCEVLTRRGVIGRKSYLIQLRSCSFRLLVWK